MCKYEKKVDFELRLKRQKLWITRINREKQDFDDKKIKNARVCSLHFISGKPSQHQEVDSPDWAPSINLGYGIKRKDTASATLERYERRLKRQKTQVEQHCTASCSTRKDDSEINYDPDGDADEDSDDEGADGDFDDGGADRGFDDGSAERDFDDGGADRYFDDGGADEDCVTRNKRIKEIDFQKVDSVPKPAPTSLKKVDATTITEVTHQKIAMLEEIAHDYNSLKTDYYKLKEKSAIDFTKFDMNAFKDDEQLNFYTGLKDITLLKVIFSFVSPHASHTANNKLSSFQEFLLFLIRLRLNLKTQDLGYRFNVSQETASRVSYKWLEIMYMRLKKVVFWPERQNLTKTMPATFKSSFEGHVAVIIDCFEITINRPSSLEARSATWSNYKQRNTVKYLIGITPGGVISFISEGYGGRCSDKYVTETCDILNNLIPGDIVLADRGFLNVHSVGFFCAKLVLPASARGKKQLDPADIQTTRKIASLRINVERVIGHLRKKFQILKGDLPIDLLITSKNDDDIPAIDKIVHVCCALVNLLPSIVR